MKKIGLLALLMITLVHVWGQSRQVTGKVTDKSTGQPLQDVSIIVKGTTIGTRTNEAGAFTLTVPSSRAQLEISLVNYGVQVISADGTSPLNIVLDRETKSLDEVVVIGYGAVKKRDLTGAVASVKGEEVKKVTAGNAMESVQGKVAGVDIVRTSGAAGANVAVTVRGNRSIIAQNEPLYIVDGIQYPNYQDINPNDIESMEVLKDASSTAIYGSRGANGVIIITTKKGNTGKVKVMANAYYGQSEIAGYPVPMTGPQFANLKRQAYRTTGQWNSSADDAKIFPSSTEQAAIANNTSTYWPGLLLNKGSQQDYGVGVSGGSEKTRVFFSFDYFKEKGILKNDYSGRYTFRMNIDQSITNSLKVGLQSQLTSYDQNLRADNILTVANKVLPYFTPYNADGTLARYPGNGAQFNPLFEEVDGNYINKYAINRILSTIYAEWKPLKSLSIRSNLGVLNGNTRNGSFEDANTISRALSSGSLSKISNTKETQINWDNIITWQQKFNNHTLGITGITSYVSQKAENSVASGTGQLIPTQSFYALQSNPANVSISSGYAANNLISEAFRLNYTFKDRYLFTFTGREDAASVLAKGHQYSFFPSAAFAWRVSDESFMKGLTFFSDLKLRLSYGEAGNSAVSAYSTQSTLLLVPYEFNDVSQLAYALNPQTGNPDLKWERTANQNIGVDFSILRNRISGSVDYYDSKTRDLLLLRKLPATSGVSTILQNIGKTRNNGFEISINTKNINSNGFVWNSLITYTRNKERIVELVGAQSDIGNKWIIGYPVRSFYDYEKTGIWQLPDSTEAKLYGYKPGDIRVKDLNGDKKITATDDRTVVGSAVPKYSFGFANDLKYKGFDFNIYVYGRVGQTFVSDYANKFEPNAIENGAVVDYWTPENPTNEYPRPSSSISRASLPFATTLGYKDGSFVKIRSITFGYTLPSTLSKRAGIGNLRWYVSAKNWFTFSKIKDYDPEGSGSFERPLTRLIVTGVNIDL